MAVAVNPNEVKMIPDSLFTKSGFFAFPNFEERFFVRQDPDTQGFYEGYGEDGTYMSIRQFDGIPWQEHFEDELHVIVNKRTCAICFNYSHASLLLDVLQKDFIQKYPFPTTGHIQKEFQLTCSGGWGLLRNEVIRLNSFRRIEKQYLDINVQKGKVPSGDEKALDVYSNFKTTGPLPF